MADKMQQHKKCENDKFLEFTNKYKNFKTKRVNLSIEQKISTELK